VAVAAGAFVVGSQVRSPWDAAAANASARPTATVAVEVREFAAEVVTATGTVRAGTEIAVVPPLRDGARAVVTATPVQPGAVVPPGSAVAEISGRPVIALPLPFPLYEDLAPGDTGPGVRVVQQALRDLGLYRGAVDGAYGTGTAAAVRALYARAGATAPEAAPELREAADAARAALAAARSAGDAAAEETARAALATAELAAATPLPAGEVVAVPGGPVTCLTVAAVGTVLGAGADGPTEGEASGDAARLLTGAPSVAVRVPVADAPALAVGTAVEVRAASDAARVATGSVTAVGDFTTSSALGELPGFDVEVGFDEAGSGGLVGDEAVVVTPVGAPAAREGVAVPLVAVRSEGTTSFVLRRTAAGSAERVDVEIATTADGYALVDGAVRAGDRLVVDGAP